ncbi:beta-galactosidase [Bacillus horti]|uniref:Beta-galactosidase n=2 Tax=Caldalkalibacillus horti TaxID=77523 RepID=A0ABT9W593_9BACI|nr:beta-galactosidase [Bacillus horti]MDQ0168401.1 beta-galactosidase [Bacillus horti]
MIEIKDKMILIDGKPQLIMCGEIHYYRLNKEDWQDRIDKLKEAGCNAVASYVPWLCHEYQEGQFDLVGRTRPELDLAGFIDLCKENDLYFFVRPGPFIMAEMKNEGIPYWVYEKHPEIVPISWDGEEATTKTIDYLADGFLQEVRNWYKEVMGFITPRLYHRGGNIIGVQLDNEIGMLSWVSNKPDLTDHVLKDFVTWLEHSYSGSELSERYPWYGSDFEKLKASVRSPEDTYAAALLHDLGYYMRNRFARYVNILRSYAEEFDVKDIPFVVNIHGTGQGRGLTFPIGISQLYESYTQAPGYISGSDIYFGDLSMETFQDLYVINGFMDAVHLPDQPLTSVEFNCGDGNFGSNYGGRYDPSAADFKTRMCIAQGNRLLNYYLFTGGVNYRLEPAPQDGNDRVAFTGERHGFAAPVSPEGELNYTFPRMARSIRTAMAVADKLAEMKEEHDAVSFAFIPDYFMTEYRYPKSSVMAEILSNIEANRAGGAWEIVARAMLLTCYRFGSVDIQNKELDPKKTPVLVVPSARYLDASVQHKLADYLEQGGAIFLYGEVPLYDMEGRECTVLADKLGVKPKGMSLGAENYWLSVIADSWAAARPEVRTHAAQTFEVEKATPIMRVYDTNEVCGFEAAVGKGKAIVLATPYPCDLSFFKKVFERLGAPAALAHDYEHHGLFITTTASAKGERFLHVLNLDGLDKELHFYEQGNKLFDGRKLLIQSKDGVMLPLNVMYESYKIVYSTAEIIEVDKNKISFRLTQAEDVIALETNCTIALHDEYKVEVKDGLTYVFSQKHAKVDDRLTVYFEG